MMSSSPTNRSSADEEDVAGVDLDVLLLGMLASPLGRDVGDGSFEHLEQGLLHTFAGDVTGDRDVLACLPDLVDFVDEDDAPLSGFDIEVGSVEQLEEQVLDVFANVSGFGQRGGITDREGHLQVLGDGACQQCLTGTGRTDEHDVRLFDLDVGLAILVGHQPLVVVVDGDGEGLLRPVLPDHVLVEMGNDFPRARDFGEELARFTAATTFLVEDRLTEVDAFATDIDVTGALDERTDVAVALAAE